MPARCIITGDVVESSDMVSPEGWAQLDFIQSPLCEICGVPFGVEQEEDAHDGLICADCLDDVPTFRRARSVLRYDDQSRLLILSYKHGDKTYMAKPFAQWIVTAGQDVLSDADILIPVPLYWTRLLKRRYNQAGILAQAISKKTKIPVSVFALKRIRSTKSQGHMNIKGRKKNVKGAFSVVDKYVDNIVGKRVVLIDDVYTTGVTVNECAKVLLGAGACSVDVLCVARTVYD